MQLHFTNHFLAVFNVYHKQFYRRNYVFITNTRASYLIKSKIHGELARVFAVCGKNRLFVVDNVNFKYSNGIETKTMFFL